MNRRHVIWLISGCGFVFALVVLVLLFRFATPKRVQRSKLPATKNNIAKKPYIFQDSKFYLSALKDIPDREKFRKHLSRDSVGLLWSSANYYRDRLGAQAIAESLPKKGFGFWRRNFEILARGRSRQKPDIKLLNRELGKNEALSDRRLASFMLPLLVFYPLREIKKIHNVELRGEMLKAIKLKLFPFNNWNAVRSEPKGGIFKVLEGFPKPNTRLYMDVFSGTCTQWEAGWYRSAQEKTKLWERFVKEHSPLLPPSSSSNFWVRRVMADAITVCYWSGGAVALNSKGDITLWGIYSTGLSARHADRFMTSTVNVNLNRALLASKIRHQAHEILSKGKGDGRPSVRIK